VFSKVLSNNGPYMRTEGIRYWVFIISILSLLAVTVIGDIPVLRQVFSFMFLMFVPGWLVLSILRLNTLSVSEKFAISIGLSITIIIFTGLIINFLFPIFGYTTPLDTQAVLPTIIFITLILAIINFWRNFNRC
jgi:uncharacterized membrane protein